MLSTAQKIHTSIKSLIASVEALLKHSSKNFIFLVILYIGRIVKHLILYSDLLLPQVKYCLYMYTIANLPS
jgi:hypothetical protein